MDLSDFIVVVPSADPTTAAWSHDQRELAADATLGERVRFALGFAILAPSIRNTQPWRFTLAADGDAAVVTLACERARVLAVADPEGRAATLSCGAALECLTLSLARLGVAHEVALTPAPGLLARITCRASTRPITQVPEDMWMSQAIPKRRSSRAPMADRPVSDKLTARLVAVAEATGARLLPLPPGDPRRATLVALIDAGERAQQADPAFRAELADWTDAEARRHDGLRVEAGGRTFLWRDGDDAPPRPARGEELERGSPLLAILTTPGDATLDHLHAGRALARVMLRGRVDHLWVGLFGQPIEQPELRARLQTALALPGFPQAALRLGHGGDGPPTPRRPLADV
ncbi:MAG: hypothetical protein KC636_28645, partial [Myxococcales bacterium]|nr:hypothetical protein [Myxococcales bacterium]